MSDKEIIDGLEEEFIPKVQALKMALLEATGFEWVVVQGRRTIAQQNALYAKGRTSGGAKVTNAKGGSSPHNFGMAVDMVPLKDGALWWNMPERGWQQYADIAQSMGLVAGYYFHSIHDPDHVEDPKWENMQAEWKAGNLKVS